MVPMKTTSQVSLILNLALTGGLIFSLTIRHKPVAVTPAPVAALVKPEPQTPAPSSVPAVLAMKAPPFQWSQLLANNNYRDFVENLRSSGCPEATVKDIVRGDTERAFSWKRSQLGIDGNEPGPWSFQSQAQMVALFLGLAEPVVASNPVGKTPTPLVLENVDVNSLGLNAQQVQALAMIKQQLIDAAGGPGQNPNDPAYQKRLQDAEPAAENMLRGMLGEIAYQNYFLAAQKGNP